MRSMNFYNNPKKVCFQSSNSSSFFTLITVSWMIFGQIKNKLFWYSFSILLTVSMIIQIRQNKKNSYWSLLAVLNGITWTNIKLFVVVCSFCRWTTRANRLWRTQVVKQIKFSKVNHIFFSFTWRSFFWSYWFDLYLARSYHRFIHSRSSRD
jgi:hypothetical protein